MTRPRHALDRDEEDRRSADADTILVSLALQAVCPGVQTEAPKVQHGQVATNHHARELRTHVLTINPPSQETLPPGSLLEHRDHVLQKGDRLFLIAYRPSRLDRLAQPD